VSSGTGAALGATEHCTIPANTLSEVDTYQFALLIWDSASTPEYAYSNPSAIVTVNTALTAPATPSVTSPVILAVSPAAETQTLSVTGTIPSTGTSTYSWQWYVSFDGGAFVKATTGAGYCSAASDKGSGASAGALPYPCSITSPAEGTYVFELQVTDSATTPEIATSASSVTSYAHVQSAELVTLLTVYNGRTDLQTAFPHVTTQGASPTDQLGLAGLINWAAKVVTGATGYGGDGARTTLQPYSYWYVLMSIYTGNGGITGTRTDLQTAFPSAYYYQSSYQGLVSWAGLVVTGAPGYGSDGAHTLLQASPYWYTLMGIYFSRPDLQAAFPNALTSTPGGTTALTETSFEALVTWAGKVCLTNQGTALMVLMQRCPPTATGTT